MKKPGRFKGLIKGAIIGTAMLASSMPAADAEAQARRAVPRTQAPVQRPAVQRNWRQFSAGVDIKTGNFGLNVYYSNNVPFYYGIPGGFIGPRWFPVPFLYSPNYWQNVAWQYYNISRPYPPIGWGLPMAYGGPRSAIVVPGYPGTAYENERTEALEDENRELRRQLAEQKLLDAERRGYEQAMSEFERSVASRPTDIPVVSRDRKIPVNLRYGGKIDRVQYDDEGIAYLSGIFNAARTLTNNDVNLLPIDDGNYRIGIKDANASYKTLATIDMSKYPNCLEGEQLTRQLLSELSGSMK